MTAHRAPGSRVSHYRLGEPLGEGGMGVVYRAVDETLNRPVAIKFLIVDRGDDEKARARFAREARAVSKLDHPNVGTLYEIGEADGAPFLVMALYEGETLRQRLSKGPIPVEEIVSLTRQLCAALGAAHEAGIVHRDLKPANVMLLPNGPLKLLDFGVAKLTIATPDEAALTKEGAILGTLAYIAPEQLRGADDVDARADLWALGALLYEMLSGRPPFGVGPMTTVVTRILSEEPPALPSGAPDFLATLALRLLSKDRADRLKSAAEVAELLERRAAPLTLPRRERRQLYLGLALLSAVLLILFAAVTYNIVRDNGPRPPSDAERAEGQRLYNEGTLAFEHRQYEVAARDFEGSYRNSGERSILFNAAQSYRLAGRLDRAAEFYRRFLLTLPPDENQASAEDKQMLAAFADLLRPATPSPAAIAPSPDPVARAAELMHAARLNLEAGDRYHAVGDVDAAYALVHDARLLCQGAEIFRGVGIRQLALTYYEKCLAAGPPQETAAAARHAIKDVQQTLPLEGRPHELVPKF